jgi:hypothetical protein
MWMQSGGWPSSRGALNEFPLAGAGNAVQRQPNRSWSEDVTTGGGMSVERFGILPQCGPWQGNAGASAVRAESLECREVAESSFVRSACCESSSLFASQSPQLAVAFSCPKTEIAIARAIATITRELRDCASINIKEESQIEYWRPGRSAERYNSLAQNAVKLSNNFRILLVSRLRGGWRRRSLSATV